MDDNQYQLINRFNNLEEAIESSPTQKQSETEMLLEIEKLRDEVIQDQVVERIENIDWKAYSEPDERTIPKASDESFFDSIETRIIEHFFCLNYRLFYQRPPLLTRNDKKWINEATRWMKHLARLFDGKTLSQLVIEVDLTSDDNRLEINFLLPKEHPQITKTIENMKLNKLHYDPQIKANFKLQSVVNSLGHQEFKLLIVQSAPPVKPLPAPKIVPKPRIII